MTIGEKIYKKRTELGISQDELARKVGYKDRSSITKIESGERDIRLNAVLKFAEALHTTPQWLMGYVDPERPEPAQPEPNAALMQQNHIRMVPVFESVSAGFGVGAVDRIISYTPIFIESDAEAAETICVRVSGDSMYPKIEDGDLVQVHKQDTAETGDIVVILDGSEAYVKRFIHGKAGVILESLNPAYAPMRYTKEESNQLRIVGVVRSIIRRL